MTAPLLLDLFCGAGGGTAGYASAGFRVVGVDEKAQPHYPFEFIRADAFEFLASLSDGSGLYQLSDFSAIHASPPCQPFTALRTMGGYSSRAPDLIVPVRDALTDAGLPWIIENVPGAPIRPDLVLCGTMFGLQLGDYELRRHRLFEVSGFRVSQPGPCRHERYALGVYGHAGGTKALGRPEGNKATSAEARAIMEISWMTGAEISQAIPPSYCAHIGSQLIRQLTLAA